MTIVNEDQLREKSSKLGNRARKMYDNHVKGETAFRDVKFQITEKVMETARKGFNECVFLSIITSDSTESYNFITESLLYWIKDQEFKKYAIKFSPTMNELEVKLEW